MKKVNRPFNAEFYVDFDKTIKLLAFHVSEPENIEKCEGCLFSGIFSLFQTLKANSSSGNDFRDIGQKQKLFRIKFSIDLWNQKLRNRKKNFDGPFNLKKSVHQPPEFEKSKYENRRGKPRRIRILKN